MSLGPVGTEMERKLKQEFSPSHLEVIDESHHHAGHSGTHVDGESHFKIKIVAQAFANQSLVQCHRLVNETLREEMKGRVHALSIQAKAPS